MSGSDPIPPLIADLHHQVETAVGEQAQTEAMNALAWELAYYQPQQALTLAETAQQWAAAPPGSLTISADSSLNQGHCHLRLGHYQKGIPHILKALAHYEAVGDQAGQQKAYYLLGLGQMELGHYSEALDLIQRSHRLSQTRRDPLGEAIALNIEGLIHQQLENWPQALEYFHRSLRLFEEQAYRRGIGDSLANLSDTYWQMGHYQTALDHAQKSLDQHRQIGYRREEPWILRNLGRIYASLRQPTLGIHYLEQAIQLAKTEGNPMVEMQAWISLAQVQSASPQQAALCWQQALPLAQKLEIKREESLCHQQLATFYQQQGSFEKALAHFQHFHTLHSQVSRERMRLQLKTVEIDYQIEISRKETEIYQLKMVQLQQEVEERQQIEQQLRTSQAMLQLILDTVPQAVFWKDHTLTYLGCNPLAAAIVGLGSPSEIIGKRDEDLGWPRDFLARIQASDQQVLTQNQILSDQEPVPIPCVNGGILWMIGEKIPLHDADQKIVGILDSYTDVTSLKQTEAALHNSQAQLQLTLQAAGMGSWERDWQSGVETFSAEFLDSLGYPQRSSLTSLLHPADQEEWEEFLETLTSDQSFSYEHRIRSATGQERWVSRQGQVLSNGEGQAIKVIGVVMDITERKQAEQQLAQLAAIVESSIDAIISTDLKGVILSWNAGAERTYGYSAAEAIGQALIDLVGRGAEVTWTHPLKNRENREARQDLRHTRHQRKDGRLVDVFLTVSALRNQTGDLIGISWIARDITEQQALEKMKGEFVSMVSHELRTPLTSIHGSLSVLVTGKLGSLTSKGQRLLEIAEQNTARLVRLINDILDLERLGSGQVTLSKQLCAVADLLTNARDVMQSMADKHQISLILHTCSAQCWGDPDQLIQVLTNLLSNAIKFSPPHTTVTLSAHVQGQECRLTVTDQGRGIPSDKLDLIFERFQQVDASDSRQKGGTGLGLAICRSIILNHGGWIWAESEGQGSRFCISLPLSPDPSQPC
ncbi:MAG: PAS domain S-box protein [Cyanobacteriota bacterium]|nr:PAS domain S-box protein [Cyanobacteriota bacterium]